MQRRYNDFVALHAELQASTGKAPPAELPGKHNFRLIKKVDDPQIIEERRSGLEAYLKAILSHKDSRWRNAYGFSDFIALASNTGSGSKADPNSTANKLASILPSASHAGSDPLLTSSSWLSEHANMTSSLRSLRSAILKRDALAQMGDSSASRSAGVEAKRAIKDAKGRMHVLETALGKIEGLGTGERQRREGMLGTLRDELANLERMAEAGIRVSTTTSSLSSRSPIIDRSAASTPANDANRAALLGSAAISKPVAGRVFGAGAQETAITRPLDDVGLVQLQKTQMDSQDAQLRLLSETLARQRQLGEEIGREIGEQNEMLDGLTTDVDRTGAKLGRAKREMNK